MPDLSFGRAWPNNLFGPPLCKEEACSTSQRWVETLSSTTKGGSNSNWPRINIGAICEKALRMSTPSRSWSSTMGNEGYFDWRENMERHQQESEQQVQTLLRETRRLQEENDVLRIQVSSSGPSRSRQPKSQRTNSKQNEEVSFPRNAKFPYDSQEVQLEEKFPLTCPTLLDESSDSTRILTKMRRDRKSQLSDTMRARLGPQTPDMEGIPRVETAQRFALIPRLQRLCQTTLPIH